jgi:hypothetical protein
MSKAAARAGETADRESLDFAFTVASMTEAAGVEKEFVLFYAPSFSPGCGR